MHRCDNIDTQNTSDACCNLHSPSYSAHVCKMTITEPSVATPPWSIQAARDLYSIQRWGAKYFDINEAGQVVARPLQENGANVELTDVIEEAKARGLKFPLLIRFQERFSVSALRVLADVALLTPLVVTPAVRAWLQAR